MPRRKPALTVWLTPDECRAAGWERAADDAEQAAADELEVNIPARYLRWEICAECNGEGRSSAYLGAFSGEDMDADPEFFESYMRGDYDRPCGCVDGKVQVVRVDALPDGVRARYVAQQRAIADADAMAKAERRAGA